MSRPQATDMQEAPSQRQKAQQEEMAKGSSGDARGVRSRAGPAGRKGARQKGKGGRAPGSINKLDDEERAIMLAAIEEGGTDHAAARAVNRDARTFRRWRQMAEEDGDPYLVGLFADIDAAKARARLRKEIDLGRKDPKTWLRYQAPSRPGLPGWTAEVPEEMAEEVLHAPPDPEEFKATVIALGEALGLALAEPPPEQADPKEER